MEQNQTNEISSYTAGFGLSAAVSIIFNTLLTWVKETYPPLNVAMKAALGHHWTTHGVVVVLIFLILGLFLSKSAKVQKIRGSSLTIILIVAVLLGGFGIAGFFLLE